LFEIPLVDPLTLTIILSLFNPYINITSQSSLQLLFLLLSISFFVVYTVNLPVVRPWSCQVIYYFDTPTLGRRHQFFGRVTNHWLKVCIESCQIWRKRSSELAYLGRRRLVVIQPERFTWCCREIAGDHLHVRFVKFYGC
jgi:hypothetical protein